ncbi:MAG: FG-GAP-like repeat-containing protein [Lentimicrobium sp.]|jgi:hypothetical protein|nr:FG-GAP-like repeat-containing protein [Lentimicrobium sp.]
MKRFYPCFLLLGLVINVLTLKAQQLNEYGFELWTALPVSVDGTDLPYAWAGGLNNVQAGMMDLNGDGFNDLLLFDRHGNRLMPFVYVQGSNKYQWAPDYRRFFPAMEHWFQLVDYNRDGFKDIFTYTPGGIMVYKNKGTIPPAFVKAVDPYLTSLQGSIYTNLLVTNVDYPAIYDLDGDGDYDILTFWGLGSFVEVHTNLSMETTGTADSLLYKRTQVCWGEFAENPESNIIYLDTCLNRAASLSADPKHTGSTFCLIDLNGNTVVDLLLGDVDYPEPAVLINGGNNIQARMVDQWPGYPLNDPIAMWSFPLIQQLDIYHDDRPALLASPFDPSLVKSRGSESLWLYQNVSNKPTPDYRLQTKSFLQDGMIDLGLGAYPVFSDLNGNGLKDLVISNFGSLDTCTYNVNMQLKCHYSSHIQLYENSGTAQNPEFKLIDDDFANISQYLWEGVYPAFADMDADGDMDMLIGESTGTIWYFENISETPFEWPVFAPPLAAPWGIQGPAFATPQFTDLDEDGSIDLVMGGRDGRLRYYKNTGTPTQASFSLITDYFGKVNVTDSTASYTGFSVPCFFKNPKHEWVLMVGSESGRLYYYKNIETEADARFSLESRHFMYISEGIRSAPALAHLNTDHLIDLAIGNYGGGVTMYKGINPQLAGVVETSLSKPLLLMPNPSKGSFNIRLPEINNWQIEIRSIQGQLVSTFSVANSEIANIDMSGAKPGIYLVGVSCSRGRCPGYGAKLVIIP